MLVPFGRDALMRVATRCIARDLRDGAVARVVFAANVVRGNTHALVEAVRAEFPARVSVLTLPHHAGEEFAGGITRYWLHLARAHAASEASAYSTSPLAGGAAALIVKIDDDVVWWPRGAVARLVACARGARAVGHWVAFGNVVNNAVVSSLHQRAGAVPPTKPPFFDNFVVSKIGWINTEFMLYTHRTFQGALADGTADAYRPYTHWHLGPSEWHSINVFAIAAADLVLATQQGFTADKWDEGFLTQDFTNAHNRTSRVCLGAAGPFVHAAYRPTSHAVATNPWIPDGYAAQLEHKP